MKYNVAFAAVKGLRIDDHGKAWGSRSYAVPPPKQTTPEQTRIPLGWKRLSVEPGENPTWGDGRPAFNKDTAVRGT